MSCFSFPFLRGCWRESLVPQTHASVSGDWKIRLSAGMGEPRWRGPVHFPTGHEHSSRMVTMELSECKVPPCHPPTFSKVKLAFLLVVAFLKLLLL